MDAESLLKFASAALVPAASAAGSFAKDLWERKQEPEAIRRATARVVFWRTLLEAQSMVLSGDQLERAKATAARALSAAAALAPGSQERPPEPQLDQRPRNAVRRALFLYRPPRPWIWVLRACFYYYSLYSAIGTPVAVVMWGTGRRSPFVDVGIVLCLAAWLVLLWWLIRYTESATSRSAVRKMAGAQSAPCSADLEARQ